MSYSVLELSEVLKIPLNKITSFYIHNEASDYKGCEFQYCGKRYIFRQAKLTPKKNGFFVTLWRRSVAGYTVPLDACFEFDVLLILCLSDTRAGLFRFSKQKLVEEKILSNKEKNKQGKRGFRVYPDWSEPKSNQASRTKDWQVKLFSRNISLR